MSLARVGLLALAVAALGAYLYFYELPRSEREAAASKLVAVDQDEITAIDIDADGVRMALRREGNAWKLAEPVAADADATAVQTLLSTLAGAKADKRLDLPSDLAEFGLDEPALTATVGTAAGDAIVLSFGRNTAIGARTYVRVAGEDAIALTPTALRTALDKKPSDLRDKQLVAFQDADVRRVVITPAEGEPVTLERKDADAWTVRPGEHVADATEVRSYLSSLRSARALDFYDNAEEDLAPYGLDPARLTVQVFTDGEAPAASLLLGSDVRDGTKNRLFAKTGERPTIVAVGDWSMRSFGKGSDAFRDKTVLGFDPDRVGRLVLETGASSFTLERSGPDAWTVVDQDGRSVDPTEVRRLLADLRDLRGSAIVAEPVDDPAAFGLDDPDLRFTLTDTDGDPMGTVLITAHGGKYYAMRADTDVAYETRDYMFTRLDKNLDDVAPADDPAES